MESNLRQKSILLQLLYSASDYLKRSYLHNPPPPTDLMKKEKIVVDSKVYIYGMGMSQAFFKPNELRVLKQWEKDGERK